MSAGPQLEVSWDPHKAQANLAKHGVSFAEGAGVLLDPLALTVFDEAHSMAEERWLTIGSSPGGRLVVLSHTYSATGPGSAKVRVISAREPTKQERRQYENEPR